MNIVEMSSNCKNFAHKNWAYDIKTLLSKLGVLEIWHKQEIDRTLFFAILKQRIYDKAKQDISADIENSRKYSFFLTRFLKNAWTDFHEIIRDDVFWSRKTENSFFVS